MVWQVQAMMHAAVQRAIVLSTAGTGESSAHHIAEQARAGCLTWVRIRTRALSEAVKGLCVISVVTGLLLMSWWVRCERLELLQGS